MSTRMMFICRACGEQTNTTDPPAVAKCGKCGKVHYTPEQAKLIENVLAALTTCPQCGKDHEIGDRCELETFIDWVLRKLEEMDLKHEDLVELWDRADAVWQEAKARVVGGDL